MYTVTHLTGREPLVAQIQRATFPGYRGKKFRLVVEDGTLNCASCWDGGSRDYYAFLNLATMQSVEAPVQSAFDRQVPGLRNVPMTPGIAVVEHSIFCGRDAGLTIHIHPDNATRLLPAPTEITRAEQIVLNSRGLKPFYQGVDSRRAYAVEHGLTSAEYDATVEALKARGFLNKAGAITVEGRNARGSSY